MNVTKLYFILYFYIATNMDMGPNLSLVASRDHRLNKVYEFNVILIFVKKKQWK